MEHEPLPTTVIKKRRGLELFDLRELWAYRELLLFLAWRDIKVRYKQTVIGVLWVVLQPLAMMAVFTVFFGQLARVPSDGLPYPLFALAALVPWQLFARVVSSSSDSLVRDQRLISKVYFPRIIVPISTSLSALLDFFISFLLLLGLVLLYRLPFNASLVWIPVFLVMLLITALGIGFWLSALNVEFRDVQHAVPFLVQLWFFLTPVVYPSSLVPESFRAVYALNPMVGVTEGFRWAVLGAGSPDSTSLLISATVGLALFLSGILWFRSRERSFADSLG